MRNSSGFHGYSMSTLYPDVGNGITQSLATVPDADEQESLSAQEPNYNNSPPVDDGKKKGVWLTIGVIAVVIVLFGVPKFGG